MNFDSLGELTCLHAVQIALLSAMVLAVVKLFAKDRPHLAHALWALVLLKCLMPPVIASPFSPFSWLGNAHNVASNNEGPVKTPPAQAESAPPATVRITYHPPAELAAPVLPPAETLAARQTPKVSLWFILSTVWLVGTLLIGVMLYRRVAAYARLVRRKTIATPANLQELTNRLGQKLEVRRAVRVRVVDGPIGPSVVGLLQPTLLLPECIVRSQSKLNLQPLIAHELVHVRRGDLWWSAVQTAASLVWWFHPCVWLASRLLTRETERSCDEETIASLGFRPADYARSLLDVLEKKSEIIAAPLVPGVRPIDITFKRMERIMRIGHGSHPRTPRWVIALLLIGATLALPGARWLDAQGGDTNLKEKPPEVQSSPGKRLPLAQVLLSDAPIGPATPAPANWPELENGDDDSNILILDVRILDVPTELLAELTREPDQPGVVITAGPITSDKGIPGKLVVELPDGVTLRTSSITLTAAAERTPLAKQSTSFPMLLNETKLAIVEQWLADKEQSDVSIHNSPKLAVRSGMEASIQIGQERAFVASMGSPSGQPAIRFVEEGFRGAFTATLKGDDKTQCVEIQCELTDVQIIDVKETKATRANGTVVTLQQPTTDTLSAKFTIVTPLGSTIAATLDSKETETGPRTTICIVTQSKIQHAKQDEDTYPSTREGKAAEDGTASRAVSQTLEDMRAQMDTAIESIEEGQAQVEELMERARTTAASSKREDRLANLKDALAGFNRNLSRYSLESDQERTSTTEKLQQEAAIDSSADEPRAKEAVEGANSPNLNLMKQVR